MIFWLFDTYLYSNSAANAKPIWNKAKTIFQVTENSNLGESALNDKTFSEPKTSNICDIMYGSKLIPALLTVYISQVDIRRIGVAIIKIIQFK